jgi:FKBP-type peptidyl-prolyl cis-trans isomerase FkpA
MRPSLPLVLLLLSPPLPAAAQAPGQPKPARKPAATAPLATEDQKTVYALGLSIWRNLASLELSPAEVEILKRAISDAAAGKPQVSLEVYGPKIEAFGKARAQRALEKEKARSRAYCEAAAREPGAVKTGSGLVFFDVRPGTGESPKPTDTVKVHYRGTLVDGTEFDSSYKRGQPTTFKVKEVIRGWTQALQLMKEGAKWQLFVPPELAYGERGAGRGIPPNSTLIFEVELISVQ